MFHLDLHLRLFGSNRCGTGQVICLGANVNRNLSAAFDYRRIGIVTDNIPHLISKRHFSPTPYFAIINKFLVYACVIIEQSYLAVRFKRGNCTSGCHFIQHLYACREAQHRFRLVRFRCRLRSRLRFRQNGVISLVAGSQEKQCCHNAGNNQFFHIVHFT